MKTHWIILVLLAALAGCGPVPSPGGGGTPDLRPPSVEEVRSVGPTEVELAFDEPAEIVPDTVRLAPALAVKSVPPAGPRLLLAVGEQTCGTRYTLEAEARDARGNTAAFAADFYGYNPRVPQLLINELSPRGSDTHPDRVELKVMGAGNMGGVVLYCGTPGDFEDRFVFPSFPVSAGDFILVHMKPSGADGEVDELSDRTLSRGARSSDSAFDFWVLKGKGLPGNNGVVSLYARPGGKLLDGVLYSNRTSDSDESWGGFGSAAMLARAEELVRGGGWKTRGEKAAPEDAVSPEGSTATRSLCRSSASEDTDSAEDWHISPTRGSTFGVENTDQALMR
jgi:hypothetical protein